MEFGSDLPAAIQIHEQVDTNIERNCLKKELEMTACKFAHFIAQFEREKIAFQNYLDLIFLTNASSCLAGFFFLLRNRLNALTYIQQLCYLIPGASN